ncbi:MAG: hypothetical protein AVDCRST_MAG45-2531, partial [uncultured Solirubrobacterales bacterium]
DPGRHLGVDRVPPPHREPGQHHRFRELVDRGDPAVTRPGDDGSAGRGTERRAGTQAPAV